MALFDLKAPYTPSGDQGYAIEQISKNFQNGIDKQTLLGVTGSGKTYTMAGIVQNLQVPSIVMSHNKTLAAQLFREFKEFFPDNAVEYFVSYYDYYQPEAYVPQKDLYIEKDSSINDEIDRMRISAVASLMDRRDVLVVASVSCIYGLGAPTDYKELMLYIKRGLTIDREAFIRHLVKIQYERSDFDLERSSFRVKGDTVDVHVAYSRDVIRIEFFGDEIDSIKRIHFLTSQILEDLDQMMIYPAKLFVTTEDKLKTAVGLIEDELEQHVAGLKSQGKELEAYRIQTRTHFDLEMLQSIGYCSGIENYSRHMAFRKEGEKPFVLFDYFPEDFLCIIDESHVSIPQIGAMYNGDRSRKQTLVDFGFRLPSALDNRPLRFEEFERIVNRTLFVSATPGDYEMKHSTAIVEQIIRPTGLVDPEIEVRKSEGQIEDIMIEVKQRIKNGERSIITTLTKKMAEDLTAFLIENELKVAYIHSEVETIERVEILRDLRLGVYDVIVGINLLREGIDLPEVSLVMILDADKMGFLRSTRSLIQIIGRSARHINGRVIMYADKMTDSMQQAIGETDRRRAIQQEYNRKHNITPQSIKKEIHDILERKMPQKDEPDSLTKIEQIKKNTFDNKKLIQELQKLMFEYSENLEFEQAAHVRDEITRIKAEKKDPNEPPKQ